MTLEVQISYLSGYILESCSKSPRANISYRIIIPTRYCIKSGEREKRTIPGVNMVHELCTHVTISNGNKPHLPTGVFIFVYFILFYLIKFLVILDVFRLNYVASRTCCSPCIPCDMLPDLACLRRYINYIPRKNVCPFSYRRTKITPRKYSVLP